MSAGEAADGIVRDLASLEALYPAAAEQARIKEVDHVHPHYRRFIELAPFVVLATRGSAQVDASPRGDASGFVQVEDDKTLLIPDRRGNNRIDSLRNILADPHVALLFLVPGIAETLRVKGTAQICVRSQLLDRFRVGATSPRCVLVVHVEAAYFQCARALMRARLWDADARVDRAALPSTGTILADLSDARLGGEQFDRTLQQRLRATLY